MTSRKYGMRVRSRRVVPCDHDDAVSQVDHRQPGAQHTITFFWQFMQRLSISSTSF